MVASNLDVPKLSAFKIPWTVTVGITTGLYFQAVLARFPVSGTFVESVGIVWIWKPFLLESFVFPSTVKSFILVIYHLVVLSVADPTVRPVK